MTDRVSQTNLVAFTGEKGHGKDTAAQVLVNMGFQPVAFAGALKAMTRAYLEYRGASPEMIERLIYGDLKETPSPFFEGKTSREFQQLLGTEFGREMIGQNIWINSFDDHVAQFDKVVCTDLRFPNENEYLYRRGAVQIRVVRPDKERNEYSVHASEQHIANLHVDIEIVNDGTVVDLHDLVKRALEMGLYL